MFDTYAEYIILNLEERQMKRSLKQKVTPVHTRNRKWQNNWYDTGSTLRAKLEKCAVWLGHNLDGVNFGIYWLRMWGLRGAYDLRFNGVGTEKYVLQLAVSIEAV